METQKTKRPRWKAGEIIVSKPLTWLLLTAVLAVVIAFKVVEPVATDVAKQINLIEGSREESIFVISGLVGSLLAAAVLAVLLLKLVCNLILARMDQEKAAAHHAKAARPKWNIIYSVIFGYILLLVLCYLAQNVVYPMLNAHASKNGAAAVTHAFLLLVVCGVLPFVLAFLSVKGVNRLMVRLTRTNQELIEEIRARQHDGKIPQSMQSEEDIECIIQILNAAMASTVRGAAAVYMVKRGLVSMYRALGKCGGVLGLAIGLVSLGSVSIMDAVGKTIDRSLSSDTAPAPKKTPAGPEPKQAGRPAARTAGEDERNAWLRSKK